MEDTEIQTIQLGDKLYDAESITEHGVHILNDLRKVESQMANHQLTVSIMQLAKSKLTEELEKEMVKFKEIPFPEEVTE